MNFEYALNLISNYLFSLICHQDPNILMEINGKSLMLCPRCTGLHLGFFFMLLVMLPLEKNSIKLKGRFFKWLCIAALAFLFFEWLLAQFDIISSTNTSRYFSGIFAGAAFCQFVLAYRSRMLYTDTCKEITSQLPLLLRIATALLTGLLFFQLNSWSVVTLTLLFAVVFNFFFLVHTVFERVHLIYSTQKQKSL
jgi:uncharacterized membrane protein